jgi:hypothetical protein
MFDNTLLKAGKGVDIIYAHFYVHPDGSRGWSGFPPPRVDIGI